jgi:hypothetical protein
MEPQNRTFPVLGSKAAVEGRGNLLGFKTTAFGSE